MHLSSLIYLTLAAMASAQDPWANASMWTSCGAACNGTTASSPSPCTPGNTVVFSFLDGTFLMDTPGHSVADTSDPSAQWMIMADRSYPGTLAFRNVQTGTYLGRCTTPGCTPIITDDTAPLTTSATRISADTRFVCSKVTTQDTASSPFAWVLWGGAQSFVSAQADGSVVLKTDGPTAPPVQDTTLILPRIILLSSPIGEST